MPTPLQDSAFARLVDRTGQMSLDMPPYARHAFSAIFLALIPDDEGNDMTNRDPVWINPERHLLRRIQEALSDSCIVTEIVHGQPGRCSDLNVRTLDGGFEFDIEIKRRLAGIAHIGPLKATATIPPSEPPSPGKKLLDAYGRLTLLRGLFQDLLDLAGIVRSLFRDWCRPALRR